ncbi:uncharacterized protein DUF3810 [Winogradskyella wandonensis]|uniref:Uncharacterized protein DUF3810 n=1 Tax=Winogradskyella wandonensis TaxID=1442586 RepID=A0A4V2PU46_9FLAO|nr:DUF3810 domain-containing protein [Winogradskyella wandonensis]TCK68761.1 uncharacterized protein DUF3810 [Winogradskyella wandonensis]
MRITKRGAFLIFLIIQIIGINLLKLFPEFVETYYSNGLYVFLSKLMRYSFGWISFSVGDVFYTIAVIYLLRWLYKNFKRIYKDTLNWFLDVVTVISIAYFAFHLLWAFNYYRLPLHKSLGIKAEYSTEELVSFTKRLIEKSNTIHLQLSKNDSLKVDLPYTKKEVFDKVKNGYQILSESYPHLSYNPKSLKQSIYSLPLTYMGFSGYLNPFTNEAQVDGLIPIYKFPTTSCHEVAHQLGYAAENEANFIGALAAVNNDDLYFKYSGYTFALRYCLAEVYKRDKDIYNLLIKTINKGILKNYQEAQDFWKSYENPIEPFFEKTFDTFLKVNNQSQGMKSYSYVVALLVNYYNNKPL